MLQLFLLRIVSTSSASVSNICIFTNSFGNDGTSMIALALVLAVVFLTTLRGGIVDLTGKALDVTGVSSKSILGKILVPVIVILVMAIVFYVSGSSLSGLII